MACEVYQTALNLTYKYDKDKVDKDDDVYLQIHNTRRYRSLRSPMRWTDQVKEAIEARLHECTRKATVREEWRRILSEPHHPDDDHDQSVNTVTTKKKKKKKVI
ncbi:jg25928 [Pararge aegeria aegeria]|uniref:Jg25928 protein n=1 Tax=Pararge aegeria aegeria TaxID=348720 RepID=A0A8S4QJD2_9NEOP|nr:jg25928 [Pararge aegeria aegeria]